MIPGIQVSKSEITIPKQTQKDLPFWGPGKKQELTAKVLERLGPDQAKLLINGKEVTVNTKLALSPGEEILLNVTREKGEVGFKLAGPFRNMESPDPPSLFKFFTGKMVPARILKADAPSLAPVLEKIALKSGQRDDSFLPRLLEKGGLVMEKKMGALLKTRTDPNVLQDLLNRDAKAAALKLAAGSSGQGLSKGAAAGLVEALENLQVLNTIGSESGRYLLPFPVLEQAGFHFGQIFFDLGSKEKDKKKAGDRKTLKVALFLDMTHLGKIRADFSILDRAVSGRFLLETEAVRAFMESMVPGLGKRLERINFHLVKAECRLGENQNLEPAALMEEMLKKGPDQMLNIVV